MIKRDNGKYSIRIEPVKCIYHKDSFGIYSCYDLDDELDDFNKYGVNDKYERITITGTMPYLVIGKEYNVIAEYIFHKKYGDQYEIDYIEATNKTTEEEEFGLLLSLGVTDKTIDNIRTHYKTPITSIRNNEFDYSKIKNFGKSRYDKLVEKINDNYMFFGAINELNKYGINNETIKKLVRRYGNCDVAIEMVKKNPYLLYHEIKGIGFSKADNIAKTFGITSTSSDRIIAGIRYVLEQEELQGHTWTNIDIVYNKASEVLDLVFDINAFINNSYFYVDGIKVFQRHLYNTESNLASELKRLNYSRDNKINVNVLDKSIDDIECKLNITYTDDQKNLFYAANSNNFVVLTGYAGTGKSSSLNGFLNVYDKYFNNIILCSPTARAAKVLTKYTKREATTIHRVLKYSKSKRAFTYNKDNKLECDLIVIDEFSMVDIYLAYSLFQAIPDNCTVIIVGDPAQLESVSVGNILFDIIHSGCFNVISLNKVFRQALDSGIIYGATSVRNGKKFYAPDVELQTFGVRNDMQLWFSEKESIAEKVIDAYKWALKKYSIDDILVLSPMKNGFSGTKVLNKLIQEVANPKCKSKKEVVLDRCIFREGDKVRHTKNDYDAIWLDENYNEIFGQTGVFNGDFGYVKKITEDNALYVDYGDKIIGYSYPYTYLDLSYAISTHSSQGSQSPVVIGCIETGHYLNLKRNLLYTLMTRASDILFLIVQLKAIDLAIWNNSITKKRTNLEMFLNGI